MELKDLMEYSLSDKDIRDYFDNKINVFKYNELKAFKNIDEALGKYKRCIILFENKQNSGHWCALMEIKMKNGKKAILFHDPYGLIPTEQMKYIPKSFEKLSDQRKEYLLRLLYEQPLEVRYSQFRLQKLAPNINTCGRHCVLRCEYPDYDEYEFDDLLRSVKGLNPDELVTLLTKQIPTY